MDKKTPYPFEEAAIALLKKLIATPSFSREEENSANLIAQHLQEAGVTPYRHLNNVWAINQHFDPSKPTVLLNSHHDTVKPNSGYTLDPFAPVIEEGKLYGLGSNDAGGCLVSLLAAFIHFYAAEGLPFNVVMAATAEEEVSGKNGIESLLQYEPFKASTGLTASSLGRWCAIVGEPTLLNMAVAEKGLVVLDCIAHGRAGHAAREEGENAIYKAMMDIEWLYVYRFPKVSELLGPVKMTATSIHTDNKAHNVVPAQCEFIIDVRVNELYSLEEVVEVIQSNLQSQVKARSLRIRSTIIPADHPLVAAGTRLGRSFYGSPTTSDKALMPFPSLKIGPGDSGRSHTANEFIYLEEIREGIRFYISLLKELDFS